MTKDKKAGIEAGDEPPLLLVDTLPDGDRVSPPSTPSRRSGFLGMLLGGALAAAGGFALAQFDLLNPRPPAVPDLSAEMATLKDQMARLSDQAGKATSLGEKLDALTNRVAMLESRPASSAPDPAAFQALQDRLAAIEALPQGNANLAPLVARLGKLESALQSLSANDTTALKADLDVALARLDRAEAEAAALADEAKTAAAKASRDQALRALREAVASGQPFVTELATLSDPALNAALAPLAETGVPTLAALQAAFPEAARETLRLSRDLSAQDGWTDRLLDFLAIQTEARSLTPREGDDPDAVLSRAEFALGQGRVADALAELDPLDPLSPRLKTWTQDASRYQSAMAALSAAGGE